MDYQGYKLVNNIILVCKEKRKDEHKEYLQAYLVDPANKKQLKNARNWATYTEYGPSRKDKNGKWVRDYEIQHDPVEYDLTNSDFALELLDCAGGSSQGGKLSFWNCLVKKDDQVFKIGINSDMLLDLLKNAVFNKGVCEDPLVFITKSGKVGMTTIGSDAYQQCLKDQELKDSVKAKATTKYPFGSKIQTTTIQEVYLGKLTKYYSFSFGDQDRYTSSYRSSFNSGTCTLTKLAKPIEYHLTDYEAPYRSCEKLSDIIAYYFSSQYNHPTMLTKCPRRVVAGSIELDLTEEEFYEQLLKKAYDLNSYVDSYKNNSWYSNYTQEYILCSFLDRSLFGLGTEPFDLPEELMKKIKDAGIKYVDETEQN